jgi:hypothetical protein
MKNLPFDYEYDYDEDALKACITSHFENLIKKAEYAKQQENPNNNSAEPPTGDKNIIQSQGPPKS